MTLASIRDYALQALAAAAVVGGGGMLIDAKVDNVRQDAQLEAAVKALPEIEKEVKATHDAVIRLEARQEGEDREPRN